MSFKVFACIAAMNGMVVPSTRLPVSGFLPQHYFPEVEKIRHGPGPAWHGGDFKAHMASLPEVLKRYLQPGAKNVTLDFEWYAGTKTPLDGTKLCLSWLDPTIGAIEDLTGLDVGLVDPYRVDQKSGAFQSIWRPSSQKLLNPMAYPVGVPVIDHVDIQEPAWHYIQVYGERIRSCVATGTRTMVDVAIREHWDHKDGRYRSPLTAGGIRMGLELARSMGADACIWDNPGTPEELDQCRKALAIVEAFYLPPPAAAVPATAT